MTADRILITGASSGIGREFARELAPRAALMWLCGRDSKELDVTKGLVLAINPQANVILVSADLTSSVAREALIAQISEIDLLVLNAGGGNFGLFLDSDWNAEEKVIALNIESTAHLSRKLIPRLLLSAKKRGKRSGLIFISSHAAFMHIPHFAVYASCKSFVNSFALTLAQELRAEPLDLLLVCPGATRSQFSLRAGLPLKMLSTPREPDAVAKTSLRALGRRTMFIVAPFDRILYLATRLLPTSFFDAVVARLQKRLLHREA